MTGHQAKEPDPPTEKVTTKLPQGPLIGESQRADTFRARLNAPISIIIDDIEGNRIATGTANLRDLSLRGAMISDIHISSGMKLDPSQTYSLRFRLMAGPLTGMEAECHSVRYDEVTRGFGVRIPDGFKIPLV
jgi:hypothetical protein